MSIDDAVLVEQCRRGDPTALERLIIKYQHRIYNVILRICSNVDDAAELTQEAFVKVIENLDSFEGKSGFYTWAFRIGVNLALNHCRRVARRGVRSLDADYGEAQDDGDTRMRAGGVCDEKALDPSSVAQNKELCDLVARSLTQLDEAHRTVIVLRDIEGMNYAQIAKVLDVELGTVRSRLSRARGSLRQILEAAIK